MQKMLLATVVLAALTIVPTALPAQSKVVDQSVIEMVALRYAEADDVHGIIVRILGKNSARIATDAKTNSILVHGEREQTEKILELIRTLDVRTEPGKAGTTTVILKPKFRTAKEVMQVVEMYLSHQGKVAVNAATNSVVVKDEESRIRRMQEVVNSLDVDTSVVHLDCWILSPSQETKLQGEIAPLAQELQRQGLGTYSLFSHSSVRALEGHMFSMSQQFTRRQLRSIELQGTIRLGSQAILDLATMVQVGLPSENSGEDADTRLTVTTTVKAGIGEFVVLGLAPTGNENSKPLVLVVRVRR